MKAIKKVRPREQFADEIRRQIQGGRLRADDCLLSEQQLARRYTVSLRVVREGLAQLAAEGWIRRHQGRGTIVLRRAEQPVHAHGKHIAVIFQGRVRDASTAELFDALQQGFQQRDYGATLYVSDCQPEKETAIFHQLSQDRVPGAVLFSSHPCGSFEHLVRARKAGMKLVLIDHDFPEFACDSVSIDDELGGYEATSHLIRLGCAQLVHVSSAQDWTSCRLRRKGFETAVSRFGKSRNAAVIQLAPCRNAQEAAGAVRREFPKALASAARPLGVLAVNDCVALAVMECLRERNLAVPQEVAVVGFNNDVEGALAEIPLTTVEIPREEIAGHAVQLMLEQLEGGRREPKRIRLKPRLILRQSCGCYPAPGCEDVCGKSVISHQSSVTSDR